MAARDRRKARDWPLGKQHTRSLPFASEQLGTSRGTATSLPLSFLTVTSAHSFRDTVSSSTIT